MATGVRAQPAEDHMGVSHKPAGCVCSMSMGKSCEFIYNAVVVNKIIVISLTYLQENFVANMLSQILE